MSTLVGRPLALFGLALALTSCGTSPFGRRTGPAFRDAFPDAAVLVTTQDPESMRQQLANTQLPATEAHHRQLLDLLRAQPKVTAAHLVLLVEAVSMPDCTMFVAHDGRTYHAYPPRGTGEFAPVADQLLREGADKLVGLDRRWCGELIGRTQSDETLQLLAERFVPGLDDGSEGALREILDGMPGSPATRPFLRFLDRTGRLDGERGWAMIGALAFDDDRVALLELLAARHGKVDAARLVAIVKAMSFDEGRVVAARLLAAPAQPVPAAAIHDVLAAFSFDEGRAAAATTFASHGRQPCDLGEVAKLARLFSFDEGRLACVRAMTERVQDPVAGDHVLAVLKSFSFDESRLHALRALAPHCRNLPGAEKKRLLTAFSFSSSREAAAGVLLE
jgi:hypothetical protein